MLVTDTPLTVRECADWMGLTTTWIRGAIERGVRVDESARVHLEAETLTVNGRRLHRVHLDHFVRFLRAIGWKRLPTVPRLLPERHADTDDHAPLQ